MAKATKLYKTIHWYRTGCRLTACGRHRKSFWRGVPESKRWRGLPYGMSTQTDTIVTCQKCLKARYLKLLKDLDTMHARIRAFNIFGQKE